ncbi:MAG: hypothetical protein ABTQ28_05260 [Thauera sp.]
MCPLRVVFRAGSRNLGVRSLAVAAPLTTMKTLLALLSALGLGLLAACSPEPAVHQAPKPAEPPPAGEQARQDARDAGREAVEAAREAVQKAGEAAKKLGEAGAAAAQAVVETTGQEVREGVEAATEAGKDETVRDAREAAEHAAQRIAEATRDAAQRLKEVGKGAIESLQSKANDASAAAEQPPAPVEERSATDPAGASPAR